MKRKEEVAREKYEKHFQAQLKSKKEKVELEARDENGE